MTETIWTPQTVPIAPVSRLLVRAILEANALPARPEFDGQPLTLERLQDKSAWANGGRQKKAQAVFDRFLAEANEAQRSQVDALYLVLMMRGVALDVPPVETWAGDLTILGVTDNSISPVTLKLLYLDHILPDPMDKLELLVRVMEASGLQGDSIDRVRRLFRDALDAVSARLVGG